MRAAPRSATALAGGSRRGAAREGGAAPQAVRH